MVSTSAVKKAKEIIDLQTDIINVYALLQKAKHPSTVASLTLLKEELNERTLKLAEENKGEK